MTIRTINDPNRIIAIKDKKGNEIRENEKMKKNPRILQRIVQLRRKHSYTDERKLNGNVMNVSSEDLSEIKEEIINCTKRYKKLKTPPKKAI